MPLDPYLQPFSGQAVRHLPDSPGFTPDPRDFSHCGQSDQNRWNHDGDSTLYLAKDKQVALAEWSRHFTENRTSGLAGLAHRRKVYRFQVELEQVLDLRDPAVCHELSLQGAPNCFLSQSIARATANFLRRTSGVQGLLVPSMALLDRPDSWCLVVFLEKLAGDLLDTALPSVEEDGFFSVTDGMIP
jgi:RES domain-containing protein